MSPGDMMVALVTVEQQSGSFQDILEDKLIGYKTWGRTSTGMIQKYLPGTAGPRGSHQWTGKQKRRNRFRAKGVHSLLHAVLGTCADSMVQ